MVILTSVVNAMLNLTTRNVSFKLSFTKECFGRVWMFRIISVSDRGCFVPGCFVSGRFVPLDVSSRDVSSHIYVYIGGFKV